jgi:hypothetical protein
MTETAQMGLLTQSQVEECFGFGNENITTITVPPVTEEPEQPQTDCFLDNK